MKPGTYDPENPNGLQGIEISAEVTWNGLTDSVDVPVVDDGGDEPEGPVYIECMIPTVGVYPIATANDKDQISAPLMSRFAVIEIPDYTPEEKKIIFSRYALPKVLKRIGMKEKECILTPEGLDAVNLLPRKHKRYS